MKKRFRALESIRFGALIPIFVCLIAVATSATAAELKQARVTQVIKDVKLLPTQAAARPAAVNDEVRGGTAVRTGVDSRTELKFADLTITRLGANTVFSFNEGTRNLSLSNGAILVQVPKNGAEVKITTAAATAAITGGTVLLSTGPPLKFMVLEGTGRLCSKLGDCVTLHGGEMSMMVNGHPANPQTFNAKLAWDTALLVVGFPDQSNLLNLDLIRAVFADQLSGQPGGTSNQPSSKDFIDVISQGTTALGAAAAPLPTPSGPPVITSPVPYVINSGTTIVTHPTITTNGVTNPGLIYRGRAIDGPVSAFAFGSTSAFDIASGFDIQVAGDNTAAGFKFTSLQLTGNPTIDTTNGPIHLGLIAIDGITSGAPGGTITFAGIRGVLLAAQNGSVNLGPEISFSGLHDLNIYARGVNSDLTLGSNISTHEHVDLFAERDMSLTSSITTDTLYAFVGRNTAISGPAVIHAPTIFLSTGQNLNWNGQTSDETASNSTGDVTITAGGAITVANDLSILRKNGGVGSGLNVALNASTDLSVGNSALGSTGLVIKVDNSVSGNLDTGANITVNTGGNLTVNGAAPLTLHVLNNGGGHIGTGGNIFVNTMGGNLTSGSIDALINNTDGGSINSGASLTFHVGSLTTQGLASFTIDSGPNMTAAGGSINSSAIVDFSAANVFESANANGDSGFSADIFNDTGTISGNAAVKVHGADFHVNDTFFVGVANNGGGRIGGNATIDVTASQILETSANANSANFLFSSISNEGGTINGNATLNFAVSNDINVEGAEFSIKNTLDDESGTGPGHIGGDATINVQAKNITVQGDLLAYIENGTGTIGGIQSVTVQSAGFIHVVGGTLEVFGHVITGLDVMAQTLASTDVKAGTAINAGTGGITRYAFPPVARRVPPVVPDVLHTLSAPMVTSQGGINFNGVAANGSTSPATDGGQLTINANSLSFGTSDSTANIKGPVTFNGGDASSSFPSGNGGTFNVNTTGPITVGSDIEATSGFQDPSAPPSGNGGTVNLKSSSDTVTVNSRIEVSSTPPVTTSSSSSSVRRSAKGGNITLHTDLTTGQGITVGRTGSLLSLLDANAPGPGGAILLSTKGANITVNGRIEADRGTITMSQMDPVAATPVITIDGATLTSETLSIMGAGDVNIGLGAPITLKVTTLTLSAANNLNWSGGTLSATAINSDGNVSIAAGKAISITGGLEIDRRFGGRSSGLNISLDATASDLTAGNSLVINVDNSVTGNLTTGANITLKTGGNLTIKRGGALSLTVANNDGGHIGTGGNISVTTGGNLSANSINALINNRNGGSIGSGASMSFNVTGALTTQSDANFLISNRFDGSTGGTIGSDVALSLNAASVSIGGALLAEISNQSGGNIHGNASINLGGAPDLVTQGDATFRIANRDLSGVGSGGKIGSNATINVNTANISTGGSLNFLTLNDKGGEGGIAGGMIGNDATIKVNAASISAGASISAKITNRAGTIGGSAMMNLTSGSILAGTGFLQAAIGNTNGRIGNGAGLSLQANWTITTGDFLEAFIFNDGGHIGAAADITFHVAGDMNVGTNAFFGIGNVGGTIGSDSTVDVHANNISTGGFFEGYVDNTNGSIGPTGNGGSVRVHADGTITTKGPLQVWGTVIAGGDINAQTLSSTNVTTPGSIIVGNGGIRQFTFPNGLVPAVLHTLTATSVTSQGGINFNGVAANGSTSPAADGGQLTINANSLSFGISGSTANIKGPVTFNGGDGVSSFGGGSGGTFTVNTTGPITVDSDIEATSGFQDPSAPPSGNGGTVNLKSSGDTVTVNSRIEVSSTPPVTTSSSSSSVRRSAKGGNINITSGKPTGVAINIANSGQLLALLDAAAPGPGGKITILATGANSQANMAGTVHADRGTVDIRHTGDNGQINLATGAGDTINMRGDIVKIGALGNNGALNIGAGAISADTMLKLYAPGSNGTVNFIANVTLSGAGTKIIAGDTVNIFNGVVVMVLGSNPVSVFTNHANYSSFDVLGRLEGGNNSTTGRFGGAGANKPQLLLNAPLLGPPGG